MKKARNFYFCVWIIISAILFNFFQLFIDNEWVDAKSGKTFETFSPHDGSVIAKVAEGDKVYKLVLVDKLLLSAGENYI